MTKENKDISTGELVGGKIQLYLTEISEEKIHDIFNGKKEYVFRHTDCPIVFTTDGNFIYAEDMDELNIDPFVKYGMDRLTYVYNDFQEFINTFKRIEDVLGRELHISDWYNNSDISIRSLELNYKTLESSKKTPTTMKQLGNN